MITNLVYFRPEKRFVDEDTLDEKYSYTIKDEFTTAENVMKVPIYLTIFQHHTANVCKKRKTPVRQEKICFYLIGSKQEPPMAEYSDKVDRIEFHGHVGYEDPVFEIIKSLKGLRKIGFFLDPKKQGNFIQLSRVNTNNSREIQGDTSYCTNVTSLKLLLERDDVGSEGQDGNDSQQGFGNLSMAKKETLRVMIIRLLRRTVDLCPNIRRITVDVPNWKGIRNVLDEILEKIVHLKPTKVSLVGNGFISVRKNSDVFPGDEDRVSFGLESETIRAEDDDQLSCCEDVTVIDELCFDDQLDPDNPNDPAPRLEDMSKLLGSILGIPTSSGGSPSPSPTPSLISLAVPDSDSSLGTLQPDFDSEQPINPIRNSSSVPLTQISSSSSSSSSSEIITYAAAAASTKSISNTVTTIRKIGNGNSLHQQYQHKNINNNEGSRKTLPDGEWSSHDEQQHLQ
ncbi:unnamed protein product [Orchesella dallaii]|uniref:Uncharacterized protein n=1 Tax=Orchesella dallaii TaxID=48710 RepID=A0ABP1RW41_9HEXA